MLTNFNPKTFASPDLTMRTDATHSIRLSYQTWTGVESQIVQIGDVIKLTPATDLWMQGATTGKITHIHGHILSIRMDHPKVKKIQRIHRNYVLPLDTSTKL